MNHPTLFSEEEAKTIGAQRALDAKEEWRNRVINWMQSLDAGELITADDVVETHGLPAVAPGVNENNAVGALFIAARSKKWGSLVTPHGTRVPSRRQGNHGRYITVWERT